MRPIHLAHLDKTRPVLVLTRELVRPYLSRVTIAPITSTIRGLSTEVPVGPGWDRVAGVNARELPWEPTTPTRVTWGAEVRLRGARPT